MKEVAVRLFAACALLAVFLPPGVWADALNPLASGPAAASERLIVIIGASTAEGVGAKPASRSFARRYADYVGKLSPAYRVVNLAVSGYNSYQFLPDGHAPSPHYHPDTEHNITKALSLHPDAILLAMPTNDMAGGVPLEVVERNLLTIAEAAYRARVPFWITTPPPRNLDEAGRKGLADLGDWIRRQFGRTAIDFTTGLRAPDGTMLARCDSGDGIHPNNAGHAILFERLVASPIVLR